MAPYSKRVDGSGLESFRPFPPMLGDGKKVDLCKLYLVVRKKGGYERVCNCVSWGLVAEDCGFDSTSGLALKLVYAKYLDELSRALVKLDQPNNGKSEVNKGDLGFSAVGMDLQLDLKEVLLKILDAMKNDKEHGKMEFDPAADGKSSNGSEVEDSVGLITYSENLVEKRSVDDSVRYVKGIDDIFSVVYAGEDSKFMNENQDDQLDTNDIRPMKLSGDEEDCTIRKRKYSDGKMSVDYDKEPLKIDDGNGDVQDSTNDIVPTKFSGVEEDDNTRERKRESFLDMLKWLTEVAKDPCDPSIGELPEKSKWKSFGSEVVWRKVLLLRNEMLLERNVDTSTQNSVWQIKQRMHPSMYDDNSGSEQLRCSQRVLSAKDSSKNSGSHIDGTLIYRPIVSSAEPGVWWNRRRKKVASVGSEHQADIPEWKKDIYESDSKWLGTRIWPLDKNEQSRILIERDPTGKGREDTCGCEYAGSYDCIKFHLSEKRRKLKLELGSAFYHWKFDCMGTKVALSWTTKDEKKFNAIAKSSSLSEDESFSYWPDLFKFFPHKSRESLVSYYFNVFNLQRIGQQNRLNISDVDSDDDESGCGARFICFGRDPKFSNMCSPKKARLDPK